MEVSSRCFIIAEAGVNHNGSPALARQLIDAAAEAGADAVKFQTFKTERLITADAPKAEYQKAASDSAESQFTMLKRLELSEDAHRELRDHCLTRGIEFLSSPFDEESLELLARLGIPRYKIPSGELTNLPLLRSIAGKGKPIILSTGMSDLEEVAVALETIRAVRAVPITLLHCVTSYPTAPEDVNLRAMVTLRERFLVPVGFSDHTLGGEIALAAVALGACVIEKHLTLDHTMPGPDHSASAEPHLLAEMIRGIRKIESALGDGIKRPADSEREAIAIARKSLIVARDLPAGTVLTESDLTIMRPGTGLPPAALPGLLGRRTRGALQQGSILTLEALE